MPTPGRQTPTLQVSRLRSIREAQSLTFMSRTLALATDRNQPRDAQFDSDVRQTRLYSSDGFQTTMEGTTSILASPENWAMLTTMWSSHRQAAVIVMLSLLFLGAGAGRTRKLPRA